MATEFIDVSGKISWLHAVGFNKFDVWSVTLHPDAASLEVLRDLQADGIKNQMKKDPDGYYMAFRREPTKKISGKILAFAAPRVVDKDNVPLDGTRVGNGSDGTVRLEVYQHATPSGGKAKAARFHSLTVNNLIPFDPGKDFPVEQAIKVAQPKIEEELY